MADDGDEILDGLFLSHKESVTLVLRGLAGHVQAVGLRLLLKGLLRRGGFRCVKAIPGDATIAPARPEGSR